MSKASKEIRALNDQQLDQRLAELKMGNIKNSCQVSSGASAKSSGIIKNTKKAIARLYTEKRARELKNNKESKKV